MDAERFAAIVEPLGRTLSQRTTLYGRVERPGADVLASAR
jgi:2-iminoacetate synthase ThiH